MIPIDFEGSNITLTKPRVWDEEAECINMRAYTGKTESGTPFFVSAWQPTEADKLAIAEGRPIMLATYSSGFPNTSIYTLDEKGEIN